MSKAGDSLPKSGVRLNKFLARAGFGSRRSVETLITAGLVAINGKVVTELGRRVEEETDNVTVEGRSAVAPTNYKVYAFNKPMDVVSTLKSQGGQASLLPYRIQNDIPDRFMPVGRLDAETTGLLLWTDDGQLNQDLCQPSSSLWKTYEVEVNEDFSKSVLNSLTSGKIEIDGRKVRPCQLGRRPEGTTRQWIMKVHEGRRRQIRRMFRKVKLKVLGLHRTAIGPIALGLLRPGDFRRLNPSEVAELRSELRKSQGQKEKS
ncbi:MAG: 23S rRNA pseudouridine2605 synthase [Candidatus Krumholzibacteriia bacterium]|jgi:23S rRNA pseudouridine2605 synthase